MVFRNVPRLYGFIATLAGVIAVPIGCAGEDFSGCEASRTCAPTGGNSGEGGDGTDTGGDSSRGGTTNNGGAIGTSGTGGTSATGGTQGGTSGTSGTSGSDDGGEAGTGSVDDTEPPTIVSFSPDEGDVDVERDVTVTTTFSEPIDESTVTDESVVLTGPDGDVEGTLSVDGDVISFVPERPLYLLGEYTLTIGDGVADMAGNTLGDEASVGFRVRDGRWGQPVYPFGETGVLTDFARNSRGDAILGIEVWPDNDAVFGAIYDSELDALTAPEELEGAYGAISDVGIDASGRGVVAWGTGSIDDFGWSRLTPSAESFNSGILEFGSRVGVTSTGLATAIWRLDSSAPYTTLTQNLSDGSLDAPLALPLTGTLIAPFASLERLGVVGTRVVGSSEELVVSWKFGSTWSEPTPLASVSQIHRIKAVSDERGNILLVWCNDLDIWSRLYTRSSGEWGPALLVTTTGTGAVVGDAVFASGTAVISWGTLNPETTTGAAVYEHGSGWIPTGTTVLDPAWSGGAVGVALDSAGNALAVWRVFEGSFKYRRYLAGIGWEPTNSSKYDINSYYIWTLARPDGSYLVFGNELGKSGNRAPVALRFE